MARMGLSKSNSSINLVGDSLSEELLLFLIVALCCSSSSLCYAQQQPFSCSSASPTCNALVDYVSPNATNLSAIRNLFGVKNLRSILGANNLDLSNPPSSSVAAGQTIRIPFPCICRNGTGVSNHRPTYTVVPGDDLDHIATVLFSRLVTFQEIAAVNNISNPDMINAGQKLWIPLPCSCDEVDGQRVVHYGYVVPAGSSVEGIAQQFNTSQETLLRLNNLTSPQNLLAGAVLDVPLQTCSSMVNNNSMDYPLLVPNATYVFTANNCVRCRCDAAMNWMLQCEPALVNSSCPPIRFEGADNFYLGNTTSSGCNRTTCAYAGLASNGTILTTTTLTPDSTCSASGNRSSAIRLQTYEGWNFLHYILIQALLLSMALL